MEFVEIVGSIGAAGIVGIGIWVGRINAKVENNTSQIAELGKFGDRLDKLTEVIYEMKGELRK
jgi:hypothetical protein